MENSNGNSQVKSSPLHTFYTTSATKEQDL